VHDIISIRDFQVGDFEKIFNLAEEMEGAIKKAKPVLTQRKVAATLFFEPSTRTRLSFQSAAKRLGCEVIDFQDPSASSMAKGETFTDTIKIVDGYSDVIIIRHKLEGSARLAAKIAQAPVINAGDGGNQHPTQTILDLYTIRKLKGDIRKQKIALFGDLKHARTMRSLLYALSMYKSKIVLIAPKGLEMESAMIREAEKRFKVRIEQRKRTDVSDVDVLYVCRIQKERFFDKYEAEKVQREFRVTKDILRNAKKDLVVLHPLPKIDEIAPEVDSDPRARYFEQAQFGVPIRMALLYDLLKEK